MGIFAFHDAYSETVAVSEDESHGEQADFDIDSDASDADLLELRQELNKLGPERAQRDLPDATVAAQEMTLQRWKQDASTSVLSQLHIVISAAEADSVSSSSVPGIATLCARITCNCSSPVQSCPSKATLSGITRHTLAPGGWTHTKACGRPCAKCIMRYAIRWWPMMSTRRSLMPVFFRGAFPPGRLG